MEAVAATATANHPPPPLPCSLPSCRTPGKLANRNKIRGYSLNGRVTRNSIRSTQTFSLSCRLSFETVWLQRHDLGSLEFKCQINKASLYMSTNSRMHTRKSRFPSDHNFTDFQKWCETEKRGAKTNACHRFRRRMEGEGEGRIERIPEMSLPKSPSVW